MASLQALPVARVRREYALRHYNKPIAPDADPPNPLRQLMIVGLTKKTKTRFTLLDVSRPYVEPLPSYTTLIMSPAKLDVFFEDAYGRR